MQRKGNAGEWTTGPFQRCQELRSKNLIGRFIRLTTDNPRRCADNFLVFKDLTKGFIRLILEEFAPAVKLAE